MMKAVYQYRYGLPDQLKLEEVKVPTPKEGEVRVKIHAVSLNGSDFEFLCGYPGYVHFWGPFRPPKRILGSDIAGIVDDVGPGCARFKPGDRVFGDILYIRGGLAEYACAPENLLVPLPEDISYVDAAAIPQAGTVALQSIRDSGKLQDGEKLLINGAGGGAGTFAIQLARMSGAEITAVDKGVKLPALKSLGAHHTIDCQHHDYTHTGDRYDLVIDFTCNKSMYDCRRALTERGRYVLVGGPLVRVQQAVVLGKLMHLLRKPQQMGLLLHRQNEVDLLHMIDLHRSNQVSPVIDNVFPLEETAAAFQSMIDGGVGKAVITPGTK